MQFWHFFKMAAVAFSLLLGVAVVGLWGFSYYAAVGVRHARWTSGDGHQFVVTKHAYVSAGQFSLQSCNLDMPDEDFDEMNSTLETLYSNGWHGLFVRMENLDAKLAGMNMRQFNFVSDSDSVYNTTFAGTTVYFPAWALLATVCLPAVAALVRIVRDRRSRRRAGFVVESVN